MWKKFLAWLADPCRFGHGPLRRHRYRQDGAVIGNCTRCGQVCIRSFPPPRI